MFGSLIPMPMQDPSLPGSTKVPDRSFPRSFILVSVTEIASVCPGCPGLSMTKQDPSFAGLFSSCIYSPISTDSTFLGLIKVYCGMK